MCFRHIPTVIGVNLAVYAGTVGSCTRHFKYHKEKFVISSHTYIYLNFFAIYLDENSEFMDMKTFLNEVLDVDTLESSVSLSPVVMV